MSLVNLAKSTGLTGLYARCPTFAEDGFANPGTIVLASDELPEPGQDGTRPDNLAARSRSAGVRARTGTPGSDAVLEALQNGSRIVSARIGTASRVHLGLQRRHTQRGRSQRVAFYAGQYMDADEHPASIKDEDEPANSARD